MKKIIRHENGKVKVVTINSEPTKTQQQFQEQCDVNNIMKKYRNVGEITHLARKAGTYADLTNVPDYQGALDTVLQATHAFSTLPAHVRKRFGNDPSELISFLQDKNNNEEAIKLGLKEKPPVKNESNEIPAPKT